MAIQHMLLPFSQKVKFVLESSGVNAGTTIGKPATKFGELVCHLHNAGDLDRPRLQRGLEAMMKHVRIFEGGKESVNYANRDHGDLPNLHNRGIIPR